MRADPAKSREDRPSFRWTLNLSWLRARTIIVAISLARHTRAGWPDLAILMVSRFACDFNFSDAPRVELTYAVRCPYCNAHRATGFFSVHLLSFDLDPISRAFIRIFRRL